MPQSPPHTTPSSEVHTEYKGGRPPYVPSCEYLLSASVSPSSAFPFLGYRPLIKSRFFSFLEGRVRSIRVRVNRQFAARVHLLPTFSAVPPFRSPLFPMFA